MCDYCDEAGLNKMKIVFRVLKSCSSVLIVTTQGSKHGQTLRRIPYFCPNVLVWNFMERRSSAQFQANRLKQCGDCTFLQYFHTRKLGENYRIFHSESMCKMLTFQIKLKLEKKNGYSTFIVSCRGTCKLPNISNAARNI